jgi:hypothetical protein
MGPCPEAEYATAGDVPPRGFRDPSRLQPVEAPRVDAAQAEDSDPSRPPTLGCAHSAQRRECARRRTQPSPCTTTTFETVAAVRIFFAAW